MRSPATVWLGSVPQGLLRDQVGQQASFWLRVWVSSWVNLNAEEETDYPPLWFPGNWGVKSTFPLPCVWHGHDSSPHCIPTAQKLASWMMCLFMALDELQPNSHLSYVSAPEQTGIESRFEGFFFFFFKAQGFRDGQITSLFPVIGDRDSQRCLWASRRLLERQHRGLWAQ